MIIKENKALILRLSGLSLDFTRDGFWEGEPFDRLRAMSCVEWHAEPKAEACSGLTLHFDKLSVLSVPKEAALSVPAFKGGA